VFKETKLLLLDLAKRVGRKARDNSGVDKLSVIRSAMVEYWESQRKFIRSAETCSWRGWPDRGASLYYTWKLQELFVRRQEMRFEHILARGGFDTGAWNSLSSITDRLDSNWSDVDERGVLTNIHAYNDLTSEIAEAEKSRASMDKGLLDGPLRTTQERAEYRAARQAIYEKVHELDNRLGSL
jgi:hypothetical protein